MGTPAEGGPRTDDDAKPEQTSKTIRNGNGLPETTATPSDLLSTQSQQPSPSRTLIRSSTAPLLSNTSSTAASPRASREGSPVRSTNKSGAPSTRNVTRSRKGSQDLSPHRTPGATGPSIPTVPSAAAVQRALSAAGVPNLPPPSSSQSDTPPEPGRTQRAGKMATASTPRTGANSSAVSSPPSSTNPGSTKPPTPTFRKAEQTPGTPATPVTPATPTIVVEKVNRSAASSNGTDADAGEEDYFPKTAARGTGRGASGGAPSLETVQEGTSPSTPVLPTTSATRSGPSGKMAPSERPERIEEDLNEDDPDVDNAPKRDSGNESSGNKSVDVRSGGETKDVKKPTPLATPKPSTVQTKKSFTQLPLKGKAPPEGSVKNMTVETETVSSIPQVAVGGGAGERNLSGRTDAAGSLRLKASNETIRPKKEKKKSTRKAPSLQPGAASSKADIFEAKVASAVGEADSSDSEETFVYESNPPEPHSSRPHKFHSRTPSAASMVSQLDYHKNRQDGHHSLVGKKSMKFANNYNHANDNDSAVRGGQSGRGTPHHHIGRFGRDGRGGHPSLFDQESPFSNAQKSHRPGTHLNNAPSRSSPKTGHFLRSSENGRKREENSSYDLEGEGADDEETPLVGSIRTGRNRRRPIPGSVRHMYMSKDRSRCHCSRVTAFTALGSLLAILIGAIIFILIMCSKPLIDIHIKDIRNVIASETELMLDLHVHAINPNLIAVQINDLDVNIFAKSKHVMSTNLTHLQEGDSSKSSKGQRKSRKGVKGDGKGINLVSGYFEGGVDEGTDPIDDGGVDEGTDPIDDDPGADSQTMLLGQVFAFDSPLSFDPSPFRHSIVSSVGELRLAKPGNRTEEGGSKRWEHVLLHDFELIVRGVFRYSPPVSSLTRSVTVHGSVIVHPNEEEEDGNMKLSPTPTKPKKGEDIKKGQNDTGKVIVKPKLPPLRVLGSDFD